MFDIIAAHFYILPFWWRGLAPRLFVDSSVMNDVRFMVDSGFSMYIVHGATIGEAKTLEAVQRFLFGGVSEAVKNFVAVHMVDQSILQDVIVDGFNTVVILVRDMGNAFFAVSNHNLKTARTIIFDIVHCSFSFLVID